jgi:hypothetical protein
MPWNNIFKEHKIIRSVLRKNTLDSLWSERDENQGRGPVTKVLKLFRSKMLSLGTGQRE